MNPADEQPAPSRPRLLVVNQVLGPLMLDLLEDLSRQGVGGVGLRGPGETQLETDRRDIRRRIAFLRR